MATRTITLCYRKIIDATSAKPWEKLVFEDTYTEFRMQAQYFNPEKRFRTFGELLQHAPGAEQLHFLVSAAARGYLQQLQGWVPDVVDNLGQAFLKFTNFRFDIINSDVLDASRHRVAISFYSEPLVWHDTIGPYLLVSDQPDLGALPVLVRQFQLQPYLAIHSIQTGASHA